MGKLIEIINSKEFSSIKDKIIPLLKPSIRIRTGNVPEEKLKIEESKIGGSPDLPKDLNWPEIENEKLPLSFIAQFKMSELVQYDEENALTSTGMLYIFYDTIRAIINGHDNDYNEVSMIIYLDVEPEELVRTPPPKQLVDIRNDLWDAGTFKTCAVTFTKESVFPKSDSFYIKDLGLNQIEHERYIQLLQEISKFYNRKEDLMPRLPTYITHRLLGYSDGITDNNMEFDCQLQLEGTPWREIIKGAYVNLDESNQLKIKEKSKNWRLLFQIDSDHKAQTSWGDVGQIYFWIQNDKLLARDFSITYAFYQGG